MIGPLNASAFALAAPRPSPSVIAKSFAAALTDPPVSSVVRNAYGALPDAFSELSARTQYAATILLGRARGGTAKLTPTRVGGPLSPRRRSLRLPVP